MKKAAVYLFATFIFLSMIFTIAPTANSQTDASQDVKVLSYSYYIDNLGYLDVVGEVQNTGQNTLAQVGIQCTISDSGGQVLDSRGWYVYSTFLLPQQKAPFYLQFPNIDSSDNSNFDWNAKDVTSFEFSSTATVTSSYQYPDVQILDSASSIGNTADDKGVFWVNCNVQNTGDQTAQNVTIIGTFYNSTGATVAVSMSDYQNPPSIPPQSSISIKLGAWDRNQSIVPQSDKIASYSLSVEVLAPILNGTGPVVTPGPTYEADSGNGGASSSNGLIIGIVVVVIVAVAGAALVIRKRKGSQQEAKKPKAKPTKKPQARPKRRR